MTNRLKPRARPQRPWHVTVTSGGDAPPLQPGPGMTDFGDGVIFDPIANRLLIEAGGGTVLTVTPARQLAETLARGFTALPSAAPGRTTEPCPLCGEPVIVALLTGADDMVQLDPQPDKNGVWLLRGDHHARIIQPHETPPGPTYAVHRCKGGTP